MLNFADNENYFLFVVVKKIASSQERTSDFTLKIWSMNGNVAKYRHLNKEASHYNINLLSINKLF